MLSTTKDDILKKLTWDYSIPVEDIDAVLSNKKKMAGHYSRQKLFKKMLESYPWFTIINLIPIEDIKILLTKNIIRKLRSPSLRKQYTFVHKRLHSSLHVSG